MFTEKEIKIINQIFSNKELEFKGNLMYGVEVESSFNYKFKIVGLKERIYTGEPRIVPVIVVKLYNFKDDLSKLFFSEKNPYYNNEELLDRLYYLKNSIEYEITNLLKYFDHDLKSVYSEKFIIEND